MMKQWFCNVQLTSIDELRELDTDDSRDFGVDDDAVFDKLDATANE
jgi:hypothetical protein